MADRNALWSPQWQGNILDRNDPAQPRGYNFWGDGSVYVPYGTSYPGAATFRPDPVGTPHHGGVLDQLGIVPPQQDSPDRNSLMDRVGQGFALADHYAMGIPTTLAGLLNSAIPGQPLGDLMSIKGNAETARSDLARSGGADFLALPDAFMGSMPGSAPMAPTAARIAPPAARQAGRFADSAIDPLYQAMPSNAVGMFGGRLAKTADTAALAKAEDMAAKGMPREQIWNGTGWFQGKDGKWRFEIDDSGAAPAVPTRQWIERRNGVPMAPSLGGAYSSAMAPGASKPLKLQSLLNHGEMKSAYPDIMTEPTSLLREGSPSRGMYGQSMVDGSVRNEFAFNEALPPRDFKSVALHEGQHAIQDREAFARGGNLNGFTPNQISAERARIMQADNGDGWTSINTAAGDMSDTEVARRLYNRLAGEVEARTVQQRMDMTPDQRRARAPWLDYDVPESDQIVRFGGSGPR